MGHFLLFVRLFETRASYVAQAGFQLEILLPQPPECWDSAPLHLAPRVTFKTSNLAHPILQEEKPHEAPLPCQPSPSGVLVRTCNRTLEFTWINFLLLEPERSGAGCGDKPSVTQLVHGRAREIEGSSSF
jgi:hypothetical protein